MATGAISSNIFSRCTPAIGTDIEKCGALTLCSAVYPGADDLQTWFGGDSDAYKVIMDLAAEHMRGKVQGVKQNGLYDFLMANARVISPKKVRAFEVAGRWEYTPFFNISRKRIVNNIYWKVTLAEATNGGWAQTDDLDVLVTSLSSIPIDARWFPVGMRLYVSGKHAGTGSPASGDVAYHLAFTIKTVGAIAGSSINLTLTPNNAYSVYASKSATLQEKAKVPLLANSSVLGVLSRGVPNVSDYEKWCAQIPGLNNEQLHPCWLETTRRSFCEDSEVEAYLEALRKTNGWFRKFGDVPTVDLNRQIEEDFQRNQVNSWFFNKPYSDKQNINDYHELPQITVPTTTGLLLGAEGKCVGRKANAIGWYEQLSECDRVLDMQAESLNIRQFMNGLYHLQRAREGAGVPSDVIEVIGPSFYMKQLSFGIVQALADELGSDYFRITHALNTNKSEQGPFGFRFHQFDLNYPQVNLRLMASPFFDDLIAAHVAASGASAASVGRQLWLPDWTSMYPGVLETNTVVNESGSLQDIAKVNDDFMCVMKVPTKKQRLISTTGTAVLEAETTFQVFENLGDTVEKGVGTDDTAYFTS